MPRRHAVPGALGILFTLLLLGARFPEAGARTPATAAAASGSGPMAAIEVDLDDSAPPIAESGAATLPLLPTPEDLAIDGEGLNAATPATMAAPVRVLPMIAADYLAKGASPRQVGQLGFIAVDRAGRWLPAGACTGTVIDRDLVLTAAHCLATPTFNRVMFIPQLNGDSAPYGKWFATASYVPKGYSPRADKPLYDFGVLRIAPQGGRFIGDVVGTIGVRLDTAAARQDRQAIGYPMEGMFAANCKARGSCRPWRCEGPQAPLDAASAGLVRWGCRANGGMSGAPAFVFVQGQRAVTAVLSEGDQIVRRGGQRWYIDNGVGPELRSGAFDVFLANVRAAR